MNWIPLKKIIVVLLYCCRSTYHVQLIQQVSNFNRQYDGILCHKVSRFVLCFYVCLLSLCFWSVSDLKFILLTWILNKLNIYLFKVLSVIAFTVYMASIFVRQYSYKRFWGQIWNIHSPRRIIVSYFGFVSAFSYMCIFVVFFYLNSDLSFFDCCVSACLLFNIDSR